MSCTTNCAEDTMALRFIAIDPTTDDDGSPTIWEQMNVVR